MPLYWQVEDLAKKISDIRRPEILEALQDSILADGMNFPSYDQIAAHGDMSRQLIRHYFSNSDDMAVALCDALEQAYRNLFVQSAILSDGGSRLGLFIDFYFNLLSHKGISEPEDDKLYDALFVYANRHEPLREKLQAGYQLVQMTFAHEIQITYPDLPQQACRELGYMVVATMYGHWKMVRTIGFSDYYTIVARNAVLRLIESYVDNHQEPEDTLEPPTDPDRSW